MTMILAPCARRSLTSAFKLTGVVIREAGFETKVAFFRIASFNQASPERCRNGHGCRFGSQEQNADSMHAFRLRHCGPCHARNS